MYCTNCGTQLAQDSAFCTQCGTKCNVVIQPATQPKMRKPPMSKSVRNTLIGIGALVVVLIMTMSATGLFGAGGIFNSDPHGLNGMWTSSGFNFRIGDQEFDFNGRNITISLSYSPSGWGSWPTFFGEQDDWDILYEGSNYTRYATTARYSITGDRMEIVLSGGAVILSEILLTPNTLEISPLGTGYTGTRIVLLRQEPVWGTVGSNTGTSAPATSNVGVSGSQHVHSIVGGWASAAHGTNQFLRESPQPNCWEWYIEFREDGSFISAHLSCVLPASQAITTSRLTNQNFLGICERSSARPDRYLVVQGGRFAHDGSILELVFDDGSTTQQLTVGEISSFSTTIGRDIVYRIWNDFSPELTALLVPPALPTGASSSALVSASPLVGRWETETVEFFSPLFGSTVDHFWGGVGINFFDDGTGYFFDGQLRDNFTWTVSGNNVTMRSGATVILEAGFVVSGQELTLSYFVGDGASITTLRRAN